jgi:hypothetical protein
VHQQPRVGAEDPQVVDPALGGVVDRAARLAAAGAGPRVVADRQQFQMHFGPRAAVRARLEASDGAKRVAFPPAENGGKSLA